jgi:hypothetical protein
LLSADTWTLAGTYLRNLILNWLVLIPLLIEALAIPRLFVTAASAHAGAWPQFAALAILVVAHENRRAKATQDSSPRARLLRSRRQEGFLWYVCCRW